MYAFSHGFSWISVDVQLALKGTYIKKYPFLRNDLSPSSAIGFEPSKKFKKVNHKIPMLSLANAFSEDDINNFIKKIKNFLNLKIFPTRILVLVTAGLVLFVAI